MIYKQGQHRDAREHHGWVVQLTCSGRRDWFIAQHRNRPSDNNKSNGLKATLGALSCKQTYMGNISNRLMAHMGSLRWCIQVYRQFCQITVSGTEQEWGQMTWLTYDKAFEKCAPWKKTGCSVWENGLKFFMVTRGTCYIGFIHYINIYLICIGIAGGDPVLFPPPLFAFHLSLNHHGI